MTEENAVIVRPDNGVVASHDLPKELTQGTVSSYKKTGGLLYYISSGKSGEAKDTVNKWHNKMTGNSYDTMRAIVIADVMTLICFEEREWSAGGDNPVCCGSANGMFPDPRRFDPNNIFMFNPNHPAPVSERCGEWTDTGDYVPLCDRNGFENAAVQGYDKPWCSEGKTLVCLNPVTKKLFLVAINSMSLVKRPKLVDSDDKRSYYQYFASIQEMVDSHLFLYMTEISTATASGKSFEGQAARFKPIVDINGMDEAEARQETARILFQDEYDDLNPYIIAGYKIAREMMGLPVIKA